MNVGELMHDVVVTARVNDSLGKVGTILKQNGIRHLPVLDENNRLVGIVTERDRKRASASDATTLEMHELFYLLDRIDISRVMTREPITITPAAAIEEAADLPASHKTGCLPVLDGDRFVGIVTDTDFLIYLAGRKSA